MMQFVLTVYKNNCNKNFLLNVELNEEHQDYILLMN